MSSMRIFLISAVFAVGLRDVVGYHDGHLPRASSARREALHTLAVGTAAVVTAGRGAPAASAAPTEEDLPSPRITHRVVMTVRIARGDGTFAMRDDDDDPPFRGDLVLGLYGDVAPLSVAHFLQFVDGTDSARAFGVSDDGTPLGPRYSKSVFPKRNGLLLEVSNFMSRHVMSCHVMYVMASCSRSFRASGAKREAQLLRSKINRCLISPVADPARGQGGRINGLEPTTIGAGVGAARVLRYRDGTALDASRSLVETSEVKHARRGLLTRRVLDPGPEVVALSHPEWPSSPSLLSIGRVARAVLLHPDIWVQRPTPHSAPRSSSLSLCLPPATSDAPLDAAPPGRHHAHALCLPPASPQRPHALCLPPASPQRAPRRRPASSPSRSLRSRPRRSRRKTACSARSSARRRASSSCGAATTRAAAAAAACRPRSPTSSWGAPRRSRCTRTRRPTSPGPSRTACFRRRSDCSSARARRSATSARRTSSLGRSCVASTSRGALSRPQQHKQNTALTGPDRCRGRRAARSDAQAATPPRRRDENGRAARRPTRPPATQPPRRPCALARFYWHLGSVCSNPNSMIMVLNCATKTR